MEITLSERLRETLEELATLRRHPAAATDGLLAVIQDQDRHEIDDMALRQGLLLEALDAALGGLLVYLRGHVEAPGDTTRGWVISQSRPSGAWNKWSKAVGSSPLVNWPRGDSLIFTEWKEAKEAVDTLPPDIRGNFRIYPVVMTAGIEPRTTPPVQGTTNEH